jgi:orotate phosphoribosyltransferase
MVSVFTYDLPVAEVNFKKVGCPLVSLSDYHHLTDVALAHHFIDKSMLEPLREWRKDPQKWSNRHIKKY